MLLSVEKNFVFIHVPKTAGSSIHNALKPYAVDKNRTLLRRISNKLPVTEDGTKAYFRIHQKAREVRRKLGADTYNGYATIACVRNPFDHAVSHYEYLKSVPSRYLRDRVKSLSFEQYLQTRCERGRRGRDRFLRLPDQTDYVCDKRGEIIVDTILKFEDLPDCFDALLDRLGISRDALPHRNNRPKTRPPIATYYDNDTVTSIVRSLYARDFVNFGYAENVPK